MLSYEPKVVGLSLVACAKSISELASKTRRENLISIQVNPLPALGVALEIRPLLLRASNAKERVDAAVAGIASSIAHLDGSRRLW